MGMSMDAHSLPDDVGACHALIQELTTTVTSQGRELEQLKHYIAQLLRQRFGPRSERVDRKNPSGRKSLRINDLRSAP